MKLTKKILIAALMLSALMPLNASFMSLTDADGLLKMFKVAPMPEMQPLVVVLSACFVSFLIFHVATIVLLWKGISGGRDLAIVLGWINIFSGIIMFIGFHRISFDGNMFAAMDGGKGVILAALAYFSKD